MLGDPTRKTCFGARCEFARDIEGLTGRPLQQRACAIQVAEATVLGLDATTEGMREDIHQMEGDEMIEARLAIRQVEAISNRVSGYLQRRGMRGLPRHCGVCKEYRLPN